jgi:hypothetical protein
MPNVYSVARAALIDYGANVLGVELFAPVLLFFDMLKA